MSSSDAEHQATHMAYLHLLGQIDQDAPTWTAGTCSVCGGRRADHIDNRYCQRPCSVCGHALDQHQGHRYCRRPPLTTSQSGSSSAAASSSSSSSSSPSSGPSSALPLIRSAGCWASSEDILQQKIIITDEILSILRIECDATRGSALRKFKAQFHPDRFEPELRAHMTSLFLYVEELIRRSQGG